MSFVSFCGGLPSAKLHTPCRQILLNCTSNCLIDYGKSPFQGASITTQDGLVLIGRYFRYGGWLLPGTQQGINSVIHFRPNKSHWALGVSSTSSVTGMLTSTILLLYHVSYIYSEVYLLKSQSCQQHRRLIHS